MQIFKNKVQPNSFKCPIEGLVLFIYFSIQKNKPKKKKKKKKKTYFQPYFNTAWIGHTLRAHTSAISLFELASLFREANMKSQNLFPS